jgi:hypothetical protein
MSLLSICQDVAYEVGFPAPASIVNNDTQDAQQLLRLANREGESISQAHPWQILKEEGNVTLVTSDQDYSLPADFRYIIPMSTWNRSDKRIVINPMTSQEWQFLKGWTTINGLNLRARIRNNELEFEQTITSAENGEEIYFEYISKYWAETSGGTSQHKFQADTDVGRIDEELITQGVVWRYKKAKGLDWEPDFTEYMGLLSTTKARDGGSRSLNLGGSSIKSVGLNVPDRDYGS